MEFYENLMKTIGKLYRFTDLGVFFMITFILNLFLNVYLTFTFYLHL